eukprot:6465146-Amphidinium_carterae.1
MQPRKVSSSGVAATAANLRQCNALLLRHIECWHGWPHTKKNHMISIDVRSHTQSKELSRVSCPASMECRRVQRAVLSPVPQSQIGHHSSHVDDVSAMGPQSGLGA